LRGNDVSETDHSAATLAPSPAPQARGRVGVAVRRTAFASMFCKSYRSGTAPTLALSRGAGGGTGFQTAFGGRLKPQKTACVAAQYTLQPDWNKKAV
ncbi:hypothetical protein HMPREF9120_02193, partial [Neisseria sp. oral taxon 020 str. F0370]